MPDRIRELFLRRQYEAGTKLAAESDVLNLVPLFHGNGSPARYIAQFSCTGVLRLPGGRIGPVNTSFEVGIDFHEQYLRRVQPLRVVTWLGPESIFHPNIMPPVVCVGRIHPGTELVDLLYQVFEIITYHNWAPHDYLNAAAAEWSRNHKQLFPVDPRPLKRRSLNLDVQPTSDQPMADQRATDTTVRERKKSGESGA
jgi:hypothetical protein